MKYKMEADVREDEEQLVKKQEIIQLLVAAGYFRARIKGLEPFDKIVGGITWCIQSCSVDLDVDLLFQENLSIGQKISLTEKIIAVLPKMKCPHQLEPHQIQGLDFIHIYPVVQWLVKKGLENRKEMAEYIRSYSLKQFNKHFSSPNSQSPQPNQQIKSLQDSYRPVRLYRRTQPLTTNKIEDRVKSTLLEYGYYTGVMFQKEEGSVSDDHKSLEKMMTATEGTETRLTASRVGNLVSLKAVEIKEAAKNYEAQDNETIKELSPAQQQRHLVKSLEKQISLAKDNLEQLEQTLSVKQQEEKESEEQLQELLRKEQEIQQQIDHLKTLETTENKPKLDELYRLIEKNEELKQQEILFKQTCKKELVEKQTAIQEAKNKLESGSEISEEVKTQYEVDKKRLERMRQVMARKSRCIAELERKLDSVPSRAELLQYQKRFLELFNQMSTKHKQTKQYYTMYNTLCDTKLYLEKELSLLNSIVDSFEAAMSSPSGREDFLTQFDGIVEVVRKNKLKMEGRRGTERAEKVELNDTYLGLLELHRQYHTTLKHFQEQCRINNT